MEMRSYFLKTFGCQMNYADSERIRSVFHAFGLQETQKIQDADYIVFNSCSVRQKAEQKLLGYGVPIKRIRKQKPNCKVILTGCMVRKGTRGKLQGKDVANQHAKLLLQAKWVDYAVPIENVFEIVEKILRNDIRSQYSKINKEQDYLKIPAIPYSKIQASVPISFGCNHFCSFCTVPYSRGEENFREYKQIQKEYEDYIKKGYAKVTLLGQTVNKWLNPKYKYHPRAYSWYRMGEILPQALDLQTEEPQNFLELIKSLDLLEGDYWLDFMSSYPNYFTDDLIEYIAKSINSQNGHIPPSIHLAVQSGCDTVLKRMNRHYNISEFKDIVAKFRKLVPDISISTDIIVGFCDESESEFEDTLGLVDLMNFDMIYIASYSPRPYTQAEIMQDSITESVKRKRKKQVNDLFGKNFSKEICLS
jgi:tRNA-2-methylthio-N6-dimethylallyladenosine synthase